MIRVLLGAPVVVVRQLPALVPVLERKLAQLVSMVVWLIPLDPAPILLLMERHALQERFVTQVSAVF